MYLGFEQKAYIAPKGSGREGLVSWTESKNSPHVLYTLLFETDLLSRPERDPFLSPSLLPRAEYVKLGSSSFGEDIYVGSIWYTEMFSYVILFHHSDRNDRY